MMQNFAASDQALLAAELNKVQRDTVAPEVQMRAVIVQLSKYLGPKVVESVLDNARSLLTGQPISPLTPPVALSQPTPLQTVAVINQAKAIGKSSAGQGQGNGEQDPQDGPAAPH